MGEADHIQTGGEAEPSVSQYRALLEVSESIAHYRDMRSLARDLAIHLRGVVKFDGIIILLQDSERNTMRAHVVESMIDLTFPVPVELPGEGTPGGWAWQTQQPVLVTNTITDTRFPEINHVARENGLLSYCVLPLTSAGQRLGAIGFAGRLEDAYSPADMELMSQVANLVAVAVCNTLNFERAQAAQQQLARERDRFRLLLEVNNAVTAHLDLRELFAAISTSLGRVVELDGAGMTLYDAESGQLRAFALESHLTGKAPLLLEEGELFSIEGTPAESVFASRQTQIVSRAFIESATSPVVRRAASQGIKSGCVAPLISHGRLLGTLDVVSLREDAFGQHEAELLAQIAGQIAIAVENALNFKSAHLAQQQFALERDRFRMLLEVNNAVVSHLDHSDLMKAISSSLKNVIHQDFTGIAVYDPDGKQFRAYALDHSIALDFPIVGAPIPLEGSPSGLAFTSGRAVYLPRPDPARFPSEFLRQFTNKGLKSLCSVPLIAHGRSLGILVVMSVRENAWSEGDIELLTQIAGQIALAVDNALVYRELSQIKNKLAEEKLYLEEEINTAYDFEQIIGSSTALKRILKQVETVAPTDSTVLIQGETGTGKELFARAIHSLSGRRERTLVKLNCAAIPTGLLESELFGHEKGAFTGAIAQRVGRFELANKGTLFLDEVGEIPLELQSKLLRVIQEQEFERLGSTRTINVDVRLVAATNRDLGQQVAQRLFRDDLFYRLNVFPITIPPLRERREDIPLLVRFFASKFARRMKKHIETIPAEAVRALQDYHWPGNIRELQNFVERAVILTQGAELEVPFNEMKPPVKAPVSTPTNVEFARGPDSLKTDSLKSPSPESASLESIEREHILRVLHETNWVVGGADGAAARLGLKRTTLQARMKKLGIERHHAAP
ncbi:MAG TPA: sigma 54-interacting transcriptional regulator [Blastocatellia bacterium]|nr:sigma 54-interacting transcriptional regulator [Blastocatellia bacterium]